jgi:hypothetical protein
MDEYPIQEYPADEYPMHEATAAEAATHEATAYEAPMQESPMDGSPFPALGPLARRLAPAIAAVALVAAGFGYTLHERHAARNLASQNQQLSAQLTATHQQINALAARVNQMAAAAAKPSPAMPAAEPVASRHRPVAVRRRAVHRPSAAELRFKKLESQVNAQGKEIDAERADLASTRNDLGSSIARNHDELVNLEKQGQKNYFEFDLVKNKEYRREGPLNIRLKKANVKHQFADLLLIVDDREVTQKHVNLYQPVQFYEPDLGRPVEVVINRITKNHIHGYVSAPKYRQSELAASDQGSGGQPARQRLPLPAVDPGQQ